MTLAVPAIQIRLTRIRMTIMDKTITVAIAVQNISLNVSIPTSRARFRIPDTLLYHNIGLDSRPNGHFHPEILTVRRSSLGTSIASASGISTQRKIPPFHVLASPHRPIRFYPRTPHTKGRFVVYDSSAGLFHNYEIVACSAQTARPYIIHEIVAFRTNPVDRTVFNLINTDAMVVHHVVSL